MADNMKIYEASRAVPKEAQKEFSNGRFSGTDINPMWRIKKLTELFGPAGLGWYYEVTSERSEAHGELVMAIVDLNLYIKDPDSGEWSKPIFGTGGNKLLEKGRASDEGYKMALTDALSVACKALGIGADVYYAKDKTKYTAPAPEPPMVKEPAPGTQTKLGGGTCKRCKAPIDEGTYNYSKQRFGYPLCRACQGAALAYEKQKADMNKEDENND